MELVVCSFCWECILHTLQCTRPLCTAGSVCSIHCSALGRCVQLLKCSFKGCWLNQIIANLRKKEGPLFKQLFVMFILICVCNSLWALNTVLDAPWCEIRPTHDSFKHVQTTFPSRKKEKFEDKLLVKSRNEPSCIMWVHLLSIWFCFWSISMI